MAEIGILPHVVEAVLNHISGHKAGVAGIYNRAIYSSEKKHALALWAGHVATVVSNYRLGAQLDSFQAERTNSLGSSTH